MRVARTRIDDRRCEYTVTVNVRVGVETPWLNRECRDVLGAIAQQEIAFHCGVRVVRFRAAAHGFTLVCVTGPEVPSDDEVRAAWDGRHGGTARADEIEIPGAIAKFAVRMRDFACLVGVIKQRFTQWYNRRYGCTGSLWEGRFRSLIRAVGDAVRRLLRRFRREMFPRSAREDPLWLEAIETAARFVGRYLAAAAGAPVLRHI